MSKKTPSSEALLKAEDHSSSEAILKVEDRSSRATPLELEGFEERPERVQDLREKGILHE